MISVIFFLLLVLIFFFLLFLGFFCLFSIFVCSVNGVDVFGGCCVDGTGDASTIASSVAVIVGVVIRGWVK